LRAVFGSSETIVEKGWLTTARLALLLGRTINFLKGLTRVVEVGNGIIVPVVW